MSEDKITADLHRKLEAAMASWNETPTYPEKSKRLDAVADILEKLLRYTEYKQEPMWK